VVSLVISAADYCASHLTAEATVPILSADDRCHVCERKGHAEVSVAASTTSLELTLLWLRISESQTDLTGAGRSVTIFVVIIIIKTFQAEVEPCRRVRGHRVTGSAILVGSGPVSVSDPVLSFNMHVYRSVVSTK